VLNGSVPTRCRALWILVRLVRQRMGREAVAIDNGAVPFAGEDLVYGRGELCMMLATAGPEDWLRAQEATTRKSPQRRR
jgi:hypothetical protein